MSNLKAVRNDESNRHCLAHDRRKRQRVVYKGKSVPLKEIDRRITQSSLSKSKPVKLKSKVKSKPVYVASNKPHPEKVETLKAKERPKWLQILCDICLVIWASTKNKIRVTK